MEANPLENRHGRLRIINLRKFAPLGGTSCGKQKYNNSKANMYNLFLLLTGMFPYLMALLWQM
jgi:hypothetical protein